MNKFFKTVLLTGLFVGTTDLFPPFNCLRQKPGNGFPLLLNYIAGGVLVLIDL